MNCLGQGLFKKTEREIEVGTNISTTDKNAFWIRSNQYGKIPLESNSLYFAGGIYKKYDSTYNNKRKLNKFDIGYGCYGIINIGAINQVIVPEIYFKARYRILEFSAGRRREIYGIVDSCLSSGSYTWSGNAVPIPRLQISIPNYVSILGKGLISVKGSFSHGWFGTQHFTKDFYLHEKSLYGKIGKPNWKINILGGINNQIQWGGYSETLKPNMTATVNGYFPSDFNTFISSAFPLPIIRKNFPPEFLLYHDFINYGGNVLGSVDLGLNFNSQKFNFKIYRQIPYELGSLFTSLVNADDGLYGLNFYLGKINKIVSNITIEGFHSYNQGFYRSKIAKILNLEDRHFGELHRYLNHEQYLEGWSYNGRSIGTPLLMGNNEIDQVNYPTQEFERSSFNQAKVLFLGIAGKTNGIQFELKSSLGKYRRSQGSYMAYNPNIQQNNVAIKLQKNIKSKFQLQGTIGIDGAGLLKKNYGCNFSIKRKWM